mgnify:CR=1 FL=1
MASPDELKHYILKLSADAGNFLRSHFHSFRNVFHKDFKDLASNVDIEVERLIIDRIHGAFPDHGIFSEEAGKSNMKADYQWIIDPIDGSAHFVRNIPIYSINIAVQHKGKTIAAAVNLPTTRQLFFAQAGAGATLNGQPIHVSTTTKLEDAYLFVEFPEQKFATQPSIKKDFSNRMKVVEKLVAACAQVETFRIGAVGQCLLAAGAFDAYVDLSGSTRKWDQAASLLIAKEAGAEVIDLEPPSGDALRVMVTNGGLTAQLVKITNS